MDMNSVQQGPEENSNEKDALDLVVSHKVNTQVPHKYNLQEKNYVN